MLSQIKYTSCRCLPGTLGSRKYRKTRAQEPSVIGRSAVGFQNTSGCSGLRSTLPESTRSQAGRDGQGASRPQGSSSLFGTALSTAGSGLRSLGSWKASTRAAWLSRDGRHPGSCPTLHVHEADRLHAAHSVLSPAHIGPAVLPGHCCPLQGAAPILLGHTFCGGESKVPGC